jgi:hypothetical protein
MAETVPEFGLRRSAVNLTATSEFAGPKMHGQVDRATLGGPMSFVARSFSPRSEGICAG